MGKKRQRLDSEYGHQNSCPKTEIFKGSWGFLEWGRFEKHFICNTPKKTLLGNILEFYLLDTLKAAFQTKNLTHRWTQSGYFFLKWGYVFLFSKKIWWDLALLANSPSPYMPVWDFKVMLVSIGATNLIHQVIWDCMTQTKSNVGIFSNLPLKFCQDKQIN